jgi:mannitol/fructose-specific phosphotransferase system IIA component (Ntr-type)
MKLRDKLIKELILMPMLATSKEGAIQELLTHLQSLHKLSATIKLFSNIKEQENTFTSSAGRGIAYPHSTSVEIEKLTCVLGISKQGIDFNSPDGHDCHLILLTLSPANDPTEHRKFITRFQSMVQNPNIRLSLLDSGSYIEVHNIISQWEKDDNYKVDLL